MTTQSPILPAADQQTSIVRALRRLRDRAEPIRSEDPEVAAKIEARITEMAETRETMKAVNAALRLKSHATGDARLRELGFDATAIAKARAEDGPFFRAYELSNLNQNETRLHRRLEALKREAARPEAEDIRGDGYTVVENTEIGRIQILFDARPDAETRTLLKRRGFRWAPSQNAWQRHLNANGRSAVKWVIGDLDRSNNNAA